ncbi:MAG: carboxymuconolactone decarboxylase family protein [Planctomycetes bacterium]|nr:carboxymuconolactone decarboxylase family protein [Planctomycetota bacterium]
MSFQSLLARPGLAAGIRHLIAAKAAIWPADWARFGEVLQSARTQGVPRAELEETLLQATLFYGFPRVVSAFDVLGRDWPAPTSPTGGALPIAEQAGAGRRLFAQIYGRNDAAVRAMLASFHGEFHDFVLEAAYGRVLTRPGLPPRVRELLAAGALAVMQQIPQFVAHARGALSFGADREQLRETLVTALPDERSIDDLLVRV